MSLDSVPAVYREYQDFFGQSAYDFTCPKCGIHFKGDKTPMASCAVFHSSGSCCHYGYQVAPPKVEGGSK